MDNATVATSATPEKNNANLVDSPAEQHGLEKARQEAYSEPPGTNLFVKAFEAFERTGVTQPIVGVKQLFGSPHDVFMDSHPADPTWTGRAAEFVGSTGAMVMDFYFLGKVVRLVGLGGRMIELPKLIDLDKVGRFLSPTGGYSQPFVLGGIYGGILTPVEKDRDQITGRLTGGLASAITFTLLGQGGNLMNKGTPYLRMGTPFNNDFLTNGLIAGAANAQLESRIHEGKWAGLEDTVGSAFTMAVLNKGLGHMSQFSTKVTTKIYDRLTGQKPAEAASSGLRLMRHPVSCQKQIPGWRFHLSFKMGNSSGRRSVQLPILPLFCPIDTT